jgi:glycosyltransferase involved in cell wall biosynthesis
MPARWVGRWIARRIDAEIAISEFVNRSLGGRALVLHNGVPDAEASLGDAKTVIVAQRLEAEKDTWTALRAWRLSGLAEEGWRLVVAGSGSDAEPLASMVRQEAILGVAFVGHLSDLGGAFRSASVLLATAPSEPFGLTVVEAMAAALPVVAADGGAHRETVGASSPEMLFAPGDAVSCARQLRRLAESPSLRREVGRRNQTLQRDRFVLDLHVSALLDLYRSVSCVA